MTTVTSPESANQISKIKYAAGTDIGKKREENQDSFGVIENDNFRVFIVADGMGGVKGGAIASNLAIKVMTEGLKSRSELSVGEIAQVVQNANLKIFEKGAEDSTLSGMGTTLTGVAFEGTGMFVMNVGDSRVYRFREGRVRQLSEDHTLVRELLKSGSITEDQAENHPVAHMLTRSLGPTPDIDVDCFVCEDGPARGDIYLLCSDGLYNLVGERDFIEILSSESLDGAIQRFINLANQRGGTDNITVILVQIGNDFPVGPEEFELNIEDTVELDPEQTPAQQEAPSANGSYAANQPPVGEDSPKLEGGVSIEHISAALNINVEQIEQQTARPDYAAVTEKLEVFRSSLSKPSFLPLALVLGIGLGVTGAYLFSAHDQQQEQDNFAKSILEPQNSNQVRAPISVDTEPAKLGVFLPLSMSSARLSSTLPSLNAMAGTELGAGLDIDSTEEVYNGLTKHEMENITSRKNELREFLSGVDQKLSALDKPISGALAEKLRIATRERELMKAKLDETQVEMDVSTRKLAVWYGRQKRLQTSDPINLASEVAVASQPVREKKEMFERATYSYLQEAEVLRYNPTDQVQDEKVKSLMRVRKQRMAELGREVQDAIENEVKSADRRIGELTLDRDRIQSKMGKLQQEIEYAQIIMGNDPQAKKKVREELAKKRQVASAELAELEQLLPSGQELTY